MLRLATLSSAQLFSLHLLPPACPLLWAGGTATQESEQLTMGWHSRHCCGVSVGFVQGLLVWSLEFRHTKKTPLLRIMKGWVKFHSRVVVIGKRNAVIRLEFLVIEKEGLILRLNSIILPPFLGLVSRQLSEDVCPASSHWCVTYLCRVDFCTTSHSGMCQVPETNIHQEPYFMRSFNLTFLT